MKKSVCVVTTTRADYGILRPLIKKFDDSECVDLRLVASGMHLCPEFGNTVAEIEADGVPIHRRIEIQLSGDSPAIMSKSMGMALIEFADYFREHTPDLVVLLGDRYEIAAVCCAAVNQKIPVAHLYGGEITLGAVDNSFRHAVTKMSSLHFTSTEIYRKRVIQMGERPDTVFNHGLLGIDNILSSPRVSLAELSADLDFPLRDNEYAVVTFHPVTLGNQTGVDQLEELVAAMDNFPELKFIVTKSNSDAGGRAINARWAEYCATRPNCRLVDSLGMVRYLSALRHACMMLGNSSSGLTEGPALQIPTVNIGDRQKGRITAASVLSCETERIAITGAMREAMTPAFQERCRSVENVYGDGKSAEKICATILDRLERGAVSVQKHFFDIYDI